MPIVTMPKVPLFGILLAKHLVFGSQASIRHAEVGFRWAIVYQAISAYCRHGNNIAMPEANYML